MRVGGGEAVTKVRKVGHMRVCACGGGRGILQWLWYTVSCHPACIFLGFADPALGSREGRDFPQLLHLLALNVPSLQHVLYLANAFPCRWLTVTQGVYQSTIHGFESRCSLLDGSGLWVWPL